MTEKETLLNSINVARNSYITADYFHLLTRYTKLCERANDWDDATNIFFYCYCLVVLRNSFIFRDLLVCNPFLS